MGFFILFLIFIFGIAVPLIMVAYQKLQKHLVKGVFLLVGESEETVDTL